jgi:hypothetical protein
MLLPSTNTGVVIATARMLSPPGIAEVGATRELDRVRPVKMSVARQASSSQASALVLGQATLRDWQTAIALAAIRATSGVAQWLTRRQASGAP